jgi:hypothetical protein
MENLSEQVKVAGLQAQVIINDHKDKIQAEEEFLVKAKFELPLLEYLKLESEVEAKRAVRESNINKINALIKSMGIEYKEHLKGLRLKAQNTETFRYNKVKEFADKVMDKDYQPAKATDTASTKIKNNYAYNLSKNFYIDGSEIFISDSQGRASWLYAQSADRVASMKSRGYTLIGKIHYYTSPHWPYAKQTQYYYGLPKSIVMKKVWDETRNVNPKASLKGIESKSFLSGSTDLKLAKIAYVSFPSILDWEANPSGYPAFVGFAEEYPWPTDRQFDMAHKMIMKYGSKEYAEEKVVKLKEIAEYNTKDNAEYKYEYVLQDAGYLPGGTGIEAGKPTPNPVYNWYRPRPAPYHVYVPGMDYINPSTYIEQHNNPKKYRTSYGNYMRDVRRAERRARFDSALNLFKNVMNPFGGGAAIWCSIDPTSKACTWTMDIAAFSVGAAKVWIAAALGYLTGGTGASVAGAATALIQDPNLMPSLQ